MDGGNAFSRRRRLLTAGVGSALVVGAVAAWPTVQGPAKWGEVEPGLVYRSGQVDGGDVRGRLQRLGVGRVLSLISEDGKDPDVNAEVAACQELGIERLNVRMAGTGIAPAEAYVEAVAAIAEARKQGKAVLVHCSSGSQRTGAVVALYELLVLGRSGRQVREGMLGFGHDPDENMPLIPHVNASVEAVAEGLMKRGIIAAVPRPVPQVPEAE